MNEPHSDRPRYVEHHWQSPPEHVWRAIDQQLDKTRSEQPRALRRWPARMAMAASLSVAAGLLLFLGLKPDDSHAAAIERWQGYNHKLVQQIDSLDVPDTFYRVEDMLIRQHLQQQIDHIDRILSLTTRGEDRLILHQHRTATLVDLLNLQALATAANLTGTGTGSLLIAEPGDAAFFEL